MADRQEAAFALQILVAYPDGSASMRGWTVSPELAAQIAGELGDPEVEGAADAAGIAAMRDLGGRHAVWTDRDEEEEGV